MKNTLADLNNYLFEELERLTDDEMTDDELAREIKRSSAVSNVARTIISNGTLALGAAKYANKEQGLMTYEEKLAALPPVFGEKNA
ncbi:MAG: hypothetical protein ACI4HO_08895 [Ruminococcus sp.]